MLFFSGLFLALRMPLGHAPDERVHALRAESLLHGQWIGRRGVAWGHPASMVLADQAISSVVTLPEQPMRVARQPVTRAMRLAAAAVRWDGRAIWMEAGSIAGYMPLPYVPGALALAVSKMLGWQPARAFLAIRLANLLCFALLGGAALRVAAWGGPLIACMLLLPMTLSLAASCSQDGLLIAGAALAVACLTRAWSAPSGRGRRWSVAAGALLALVIAGKPPYAPLAGLLLLPLRDLGRLPARLAAAMLVVAPALAWTWLESRLTLPAVLPVAEAGPLWPGPRPALFHGADFAAQLRVLQAGPWRAVTLPIGSVVRNADELLHEAVGMLDYLNLVLPRGLYVLWFRAIGAALLSSGVREDVRAAGGTRAPPGVVDRVFVAALLAAAVCCVGTALYLQWTPVGAAGVAGLQGRYLLPLLPALALALPRVAPARAARWLGAAPTLVALVDLVWLPWVVVAAYPDAG